MDTRYLILGAGLSGLSTAYHLERAGRGDWLVLEKEERPGGLCRSVSYDDGFTFDHSIHILYSADPYATALIQKLLGENLTVQQRESWVYTYGAYTPYPWQANTYGLPIEVVKECLMGVIQATYEQSGREPRNFEQWCHATFGEGLARHFMIPYNRKLWAIDPSKMTDAWIRERVMTPAIEEVVEGALHRQEKAFGPNSVFWYPNVGGIEALPLGFVTRLPEKRILSSMAAARIDWRKRRVLTTDGRSLGYEQLVTSLPLPALVRLLAPEPPSAVRDAAGRLFSNTVYAVNLTVKREDISPYHWVYFPEEKYVFHRISFPGNFAPTQVPPGWSSITVEVSTSPEKRVAGGETLREQVLSGLRETGILRTDDTVQMKPVLVLNPAYVVYTHTHRSDRDGLHRFLREQGIHPCGRFGEWEYLNMDHAILSGRRAAEALMTEG